MGAGTQDSPIAIDDDSEDEVFNELYQDSADASPHIVPNLSLPEDRRRLTPPHATMLNTSSRSPDNRNMHSNKRKRAHSFTSQDAGSSNAPRQHPSLVNRLSQPESKKAKKRRRKAERQAHEEARLQNINWLVNGRLVAAPSHPTIPLASWIPMQHLTNGYPTQPIFGPENHPFPGFVDNQGLSYRYPYNTLPEPPSYENYDPSPSPQPPPKTSSDWVSSMALAADHSFNQTNIVNELPRSAKPPVPPPALPPITTNAPPKQGAASTSTPKPVEHHALPSKPPPPQSVGTIGMKPDPDPNSKHGIFHITPSTKEAGSDMKKRSASYIPNPARTLVIEQLPKTHRHADFINNWSRSACGAVPVHIFIDGNAGKALIEFASAESARKAWASPKLGASYANLKPHQLKGKIREDLIKVWWYRVDGVGAGAGVGEIEEGEIEGDATTEKDVDVFPKKETKKERKARLAKEREEKRLRELELRRVRELKQQQERPIQQHQLPNPLESQNIGNASAIATSYQGPTLPPNNPIHHNPPYTSPIYSMPPIFTQQYVANAFGWTPSQPSHQHRSTTSTDSFINKTAYGASVHDDLDERESIASSAGRSDSPTADRPQATGGQGDDLEDYEDVDMDVDEISPIATSRPTLPAVPPIHSSLPPRPAPAVISQHNKPLTQKPPPHTPSATAPVFVPRAAQNLQPPVSRPLPSAPKSAAPAQKPSIMVQSSLSTNGATSSIIAPQPRLSSSSSSSTVLMTSTSLPPPPTSAATAPPTSAASSVSSSSSSSPAPVPSEPKAMKNAPTEPSFTKRALMARQKELEEKIAKSKMELAAAANKAGNSTTVSTESRPMSQARPSMDLGEKQAMEDRLRKLVLQSRKPAVQAEPPPDPVIPPPSPATVVAPSEQSAASKSSSTTFSASAPGFLLEDMAVSFITQTIETMKTQPTSVADSPRPPARSVSQSDVRVELAAKQKRLEEHISESKSLMTKLSQARTKDEKDNIMRTIREKTRLFEEASSDQAISTTSSKTGWTRQLQTTTAQQYKISRWPVNHEDAGVLIISDDEDEHDD